MDRKCLLVIADEYPLILMSEEERAVAIKGFLEFRRQYAYRRKYKDLKSGKILRYFYPSKGPSEFEKEIFKRCRKSGRIEVQK